LRLSAGETQGLTKIVSTPKITVLDNLEAKIEQGESIPFQTTSAQGTQTIFIDASLTLTVKPHISSDGGIVMKVSIKKNAPGDSRSQAGPSILKKEATTSVLVLDGESIAVGGIQETIDVESSAGIPFLMNLPIIGGLFKNKEKRKENTELLVFITPKIVR
jgi:type IV pilus assembly protein PilQ